MPVYTSVDNQHLNWFTFQLALNSLNTVIDWAFLRDETGYATYIVAKFGIHVQKEGSSLYAELVSFPLQAAGWHFTTSKYTHHDLFILNYPTMIVHFVLHLVLRE